VHRAVKNIHWLSSFGSGGKFAFFNLSLPLLQIPVFRHAADFRAFLCLYDAHISKQESRAVARKPCDAAAVLFGLKFADDIHYKFKSSQFESQASELQPYRHKTEFNAKWRFKVIQSHVLGVSRKAIRH